MEKLLEWAIMKAQNGKPIDLGSYDKGEFNEWLKNQIRRSKLTYNKRK
jgi:hypothetical protein